MVNVYVAGLVVAICRWGTGVVETGVEQGLLDGRGRVRNFRGRLRWASSKRRIQLCMSGKNSSADMALPDENDHVCLARRGGFC